MELRDGACLTFPSHGTVVVFGNRDEQLCLTDVDLETERWLRSLSTSIPLTVPARATRTQKLLTDAGFLVHAPVTPAPAARPAPAHMRWEEAALQAQGYGVEESRIILDRRSRAVVAVRGLSPTMVALITHAVGLGVRHLVIDDVGAPQPSGILSGVFERGRSRREGAISYLTTRYPVTIRRADSPIDVVVIKARGEDHDRLASAMLSVEHVPHLFVVEEATRIRIGPFVIPGSTACVDCCAASLHNTPTHSRSAPVADTDDPPYSHTSRAVAAAIAGHEIASFLGGEQPHTSTHVMTVSNGAVLPQRHEWGSCHPCDCFKTHSSPTLASGIRQ